MALLCLPGAYTYADDNDDGKNVEVMRLSDMIYAWHTASVQQLEAATFIFLLSSKVLYFSFYLREPWNSVRSTSLP